jgi:energy-coupling factor transport system ATP-binding protein
MEYPSLQLEGVTYTYPGERGPAIQDISVTVRAGECIALTGPSGCGKTTVLRVARGLFEEDGGTISGKVSLEGEDVTSKALLRMAGKVGLVFQDPAYQLHMPSVLEEVRSGLMYGGEVWDICEKRATAVIEKFLPRGMESRAPEDLSCGEQQMVAIAAAMAPGCNVLLLDEPVSFLDPKNAQTVVSLLAELKEQGIAILLSAHNLEPLASVLDRVLILRNGRIVFQGPVPDVLDSHEQEAESVSPLWCRIVARSGQREALHHPELGWHTIIQTLEKLGHKERREGPAQTNVISRNAARQPVLVLEQVACGYSSKERILSGVSVALHRGEIVGVIGPNGSGKSTLARVIIGLLVPSEGRVVLEGQDVTRRSPGERAQVMSFVPQNPSDSLFAPSVRVECEFGPRVLLRPNVEDAATAAIKSMGIGDLANRSPYNLSGGEKRLVTLAAALAPRPKILVLDEPEYGLDLRSWYKIETMLRSFALEGGGVILITHMLESCLFLCDRVVVLTDGRLQHDGEPVTLLANHEIMALLGGLPVPAAVVSQVTGIPPASDRAAFVEAVSSLLANTQGGTRE